MDQREPPAPLDAPASKPALALERSSLGVSMTAFAILALIALLTARALAPALPGSATGLALWIAGATFVAACTSQLLAAGGIALCLRLLGNVLIQPGLGVAFRMLILPVTLGIVALVVAASARALDPNLGRVLSILCLLAPGSAAALLLARNRTRAVGIVLLFGAAAAGSDLAAFEASWRSASVNAGRGFAIAALLLDASAAVLAFVWVARANQSFALRLALGLLVLTIAITIASRAGSQASVGWQVVLERSIEGLTRRPVRASPSALADLAALLPIVVAGAVLAVRGRNAELRAALALCLLGRSGTGAPAAALLSVGATLLAVPHSLQEFVEHPRPKSPS